MPEGQMPAEPEMPQDRSAEFPDCKHDQFSANVRVGRLTDKEGGPVTSYTCEVMVSCEQCGLPFHFMGLEQGSSWLRPMTNPIGTELRAPIAPGKAAIQPRQIFEVKPQE